MTQIMMVQPAAPPVQSNSSQIDAVSGDQFSSHLDRAIKSDNQHSSENTPQAKPDLDKSPSETSSSDLSSSQDSTKNSEPTETTGEALTGANTNISRKGSGNRAENLFAAVTVEATKDNSIVVADLENTKEASSVTTDSETSVAQNVLKGEGLTTAVTNAAIAGTNVAPAQSVQVAGTLAAGQTAQTPSHPSQNSGIQFPHFTLHSQETPALQVLSNPQLSGVQKQNGQSQEALLAQIQKIIDSSSEKGTVSITKAGPPQESSTVTTNIAQTTLAATTSPEAPLSQSSFGVDGNALKGNGEKSDVQLTSLRQNTQQQYYDAKITPQNASEQNSDSKNQQQSDSSTPQATTSTQAGAGQTSTTPGADYTQVSATIAQSITAEPLLDTARPILLPSGNVFTEDDIMQQLVERFQITKRQLETKLNIKLHPAELGELKIDLNVKESSIRAVVVAQSLHVQELIEKNLAKLRTVLEDQGYTIEEILVTSESDSVGDFDLFDKSLSRNDDYVPQQMKKDSSYTDAEFTLEELTMNPLPSDIGVNVKA